MSFTNIPQGTPHWDTNVNAAFAAQDAALTGHEDGTDPHGDRAYADAHVGGGNLGGTAAAGTVIAATSGTGRSWIHTKGAGPWVFNVAAYGAVGDGRVTTDGAINVGVSNNTLTCASAPFTNADVGKAIMIKGAAATGVTTLVTTISAVTDSSHVTLAAAASTTVAGATVMWATDDTAAVQAAINAACAWAAANAGTATVFIPPSTGFYGIAGPLVTGGLTLGNAQLTLPVVATAGKKIVLTISGSASGAAVQHWQQTAPQYSGALVSFGVFSGTGTQSGSISASGNPCVIGGPAQPGGYGVAPGVYSNMLVCLRDLSILTTYSLYGLTYSAFDFSGVANASLENVGYGTTGNVPGNDFVSPAQFANGLSVGGLLPANGNNDLTYVKNVTVHGGYTYGLFATEHTVADRLTILYCWSGLCPVGIYFGSVGATHALYVAQLSVESCTNNLYFIGAGSGGVGPFVDIAQMDTETSTPTFGDNASGTALASALGTVKLTGLYTAANISTGGKPTGLVIVDGQNPSGVRSVSAAAAVRLTDRTILGNTTTAGFTVTLLSAVANHVPVQIRNTGSVNTLTVAAAGGQTIDGSATKALTAGQSARLVSDGSNWFTV